jgi:uncharacterized protein (TIGR02246 family)
MNIHAQYLTLLLAMIAAALASGCASLPKVDAKSDEQTIRALDAEFGAAAARKDLAAEVALYAPDATMLPNDAPAAKGTVAIRLLWTEILKTPGLSINIVPEKIDISAAGDLATDMGHAETAMDGPQGRVKSLDKYLEVWRKVDGHWKVMYDTWNSNESAR